MMSEKIIGFIAVGVIFTVFFGMLIHAELITDEKRFLITELGNIHQTTIGQSFEYPSNPPNIDVHFIEILPGAESGWHTHDTPLVVTVLHGEITVHYCNEEIENSADKEQCNDKGIVRNFQTGDSFVEAINIEHNGVNDGVIPVKLHVITLNPDENWKDIYSPDD